MALGLSRSELKPRLAEYDAYALKPLGIYAVVKLTKYPASSLYIKRESDYNRWRGNLLSLGSRPHSDIKDVKLGDIVYINKQTLPKHEFQWQDEYFGMHDTNDLVATGPDTDDPLDVRPLGPLFMVKRVFWDGLVNGVYRPEAPTMPTIEGIVVSVGDRVSDEVKSIGLGDKVTLHSHAMRFHAWQWEGSTYDIFNTDDIEAVL